MIWKSRNWSAVAWLLAIFLSTIIVYRSSLSFFFSQDDFVFLARAANVGSLSDFLRLFTANDHFYRPVPRVAILLAEWRLFGPNASAFHLCSVIIHATNAMLLFLLCRRMFASTFLAAFSGLLYATHHMPFLAVYWVSGIQDLSMTLFLLLSMHLYLQFAEGRGKLWLAFSLLAYGLALLSKELAITFPALIVLVASLRMARSRQAKALPRCLGHALSYAVVAGLYLVVRSQKAAAFIPAEGPYALSFAPDVALENLYTYVSDTLYVRDWLASAPHRVVLVGVIFSLVLVLTIWQSRLSRRVIALGAGWFVISLIPVLLLSDRAYSFYAYFPLAGMAMVLAAPPYALLSRVRVLQTYSKPALRLARGIGVALLLVGWLYVAADQIISVEAKDPAGILSKSIVARDAITEVQAQFPTLPEGSTLYVIGSTDLEFWAFGRGDLFRLYYPSVEVIMVSEEPEAQLDAADPGNVHFYYPGNGR